MIFCVSLFLCFNAKGWKILKMKINRVNEEKDNKQALTMWLRDRFGRGEIPRVTDVVKYAKREKMALSKKDVVNLMHSFSEYEMSLHQQRPRLRSRKYRPIIVTSLGHLHGDIGFFPINEHYETPPTYRAGFLICVDILSKFVYIEVLRKNRKAEQIISALTRIIQKHHKAGHKHPIRSIAFDQEQSVMGKKVQGFLKENGISFHAFRHSSSKSKMAENTIGRLRALFAKLDAFYNYTRKWWDMTGDAEYNFNYTWPIVIDGVMLPYTPASISVDNVQDYLDALYKASPVLYFAQFNIDPDKVNFKFEIGNLVRAKRIVVSSAVLGTKRSGKQLTDEVFEITYRCAYLKRNRSVGKLYRCKNIDNPKEIENFDQDDLALAAITSIRKEEENV